MLALLLAFQTAAPGPDAPVGSSRTLTPPRVSDAAVAIDGRLDEPVWAQSGQLRDFSQYLPADGRPAQDSTVVLVWYSPTAIHFGVRAFQDSATVRATLADRDRIAGDDQIVFLLDTFNDRRQAFFFAVNPLGQQADGTAQDAARQVAGLLSATNSGAYSTDHSPDFAFESRGRLTAQGYELEVRIPFRSLRYQASERQSWGLNVIRRVQLRGHEHTWAPVLHSDASFLGRSGTLEGLTDLRRGLVLDVTPEVKSAIPGARDSAGAWDYSGGSPALGVTARWGLTSNLTLNGTVNPDFSQVESDVPQLVFDPRESLFFPEKRPFFLDGLERFGSPIRLIYTRRLADPTGAVKLTGKTGPTSVALLSGVDDPDLSATDRTPFLTALRLRRDVGSGSTLGLTLTDREEGARFNRVGAVDGRLVWGGANTLVFQTGGSATSTGAPGAETLWAPFWYLQYNRAGRRFAFSASSRGLHPDFRAQTGFISRGDVAYAALQPSYTIQRARGARVESFSASMLVDGRWYYERFTNLEEPDDQRLHFNFNVALRGGWGVGASFLLESFGYPAELYAGYAIDNGCAFPVTSAPGTLPGCALPFTGVPRITNRDLVLNLSTPRLQSFSADFNVFWGRDENFEEWAPATIVIGTLNVTWRPTEQLRANLLYNHQHYIRRTDGSTVRQRRVPRLKVEYQLTRAIFVRLVGQYDAEEVDALRDDSRTGLPLIAQDPAGAWARIPGTRRNDVGMDWLFSYRPTPGTVLFAGYGSLMEDAGEFRLSGLRRRSDGFFFKASYQFRS